MLINYLIGFLVALFFFEFIDTDFRKSYFENAERMLPQSSGEQRVKAYKISLIIYSVLWPVFFSYRLIRLIVKFFLK